MEMGGHDDKVGSRLTSFRDSRQSLGRDGEVQGGKAGVRGDHRGEENTSKLDDRKTNAFAIWKTPPNSHVHKAGNTLWSSAAATHTLGNRRNLRGCSFEYSRVSLLSLSSSASPLAVAEINTTKRARCVSASVGGVSVDGRFSP
jgi:hypothetical protein